MNGSSQEIFIIPQRGNSLQKSYYVKKKQQYKQYNLKKQHTWITFKITLSHLRTESQLQITKSVT